MSPASRYRLTRALGAGGMALVYEAMAVGERGFERRVAIKRILPERAGDEAMRRMFLDEARIASQLHHGNIVQVLDFGILDGCEFLVMEHVDGLDARAAVRRSLAAGIPIEPGVALHITAEIAHALAHLDRNDVVHRDVSPQNVLLSWEGDVKLTDFGVAFAASREAHTVTGVVKGKRSYMAPEQARGLDVGPRADVYALGATLYELLTGEPPDVELGALRDAGLTEELEHLLWVMLRPEPNQRPDAAEVAGAAGRLAATMLARGGRDRLVAWLARVRAVSQPPPSKLDDVMGLCLVPANDAPEGHFTVTRSATDLVTDVVTRRRPVVSRGTKPDRPWILVAIAITFGTLVLGVASLVAVPRIVAAIGDSSTPSPPSPPEPVAALGDASPSTSVGEAWLRIVGLPLRGGAVHVDGRYVGDVPLRVPFSVGPHHVVVYARGTSTPLIDRTIMLDASHTQARPMFLTLRGPR